MDIVLVYSHAGVSVTNLLNDLHEPFVPVFSGSSIQIRESREASVTLGHFECKHTSASSTVRGKHAERSSQHC